MEAFITFACEHAHSAHWIIFLLLMLAGLNVPISEDLLLIIAGIVASTCIPEQTFHLWAWVFMGSWISAWEAYWIGRYFGPKLYNIRWFRRIVSPKRIEKLHYYYEKFGILTFIVGRFCPGGIRNGLFLTSGLGRMPFLTFILRDGLAACISVSTLFYIGFSFGANHEAILRFFHTYQEIVLAIMCVLLLTFGAFYIWRRYKKETSV